ncbi:phasin family protein [Salsuginibacillus kocurii]|uniref:phasin family protein n=1 Tax=Salsuginibacillus kocurii TaxID=427078 RepID=UPI00036E3931|nr:hypothetical protein [Salsuginibacillus kocurii]
MNDFVKKGFLFGLGAALSTRDKVQTYVDDLVYKGKITPTEAEEWVDQLVDKGAQKEEELSHESKMKIQEALSDLGMATKEDVARLELKLAQLEELLQNRSEQPPNEGDER